MATVAATTAAATTAAATPKRYWLQLVSRWFRVVQLLIYTATALAAAGTLRGRSSEPKVAATPPVRFDVSTLPVPHR
jgi:hypothetical protein